MYLNQYLSFNEMTDEVKIPKKRGRKPKGGKIVELKPKLADQKEMIHSVILHLKCKKSEIIKNHMDTNIYNIEPYSKDGMLYEILPHNPTEQLKEYVLEKNEDKDQRKIYEKLSELEKNLHLDNIDNKSNCFWCTCSFDTHPVYLPKLKIKEKYNVYGCFCSPECATSYLFNEPMVETIKYERYQMLNYIYGKIYEYKEVIKMAPSPYYTLDKYYGNLTIQEYRKLLKYDRLLLFTEKPLTKIYPELHEDNTRFEPMYNHRLIMKKNAPINKKKHIESVFQL
jgi:hypothetical protein